MSFISQDAMHTFFAALQDVKIADIVPEGFGVAEPEWGEQFYGETETVKVGRKDVKIVLPFEIWWPRAVAWAQGLEVMVRIQAAEAGEILN
jgi:hypothetical protein